MVQLVLVPPVTMEPVAVWRPPAEASLYPTARKECEPMGADKYQAGIGADKILGNQMKPYSNLLSIQRKGFLIQHPDVARALIDAGYSISKTGQIAASR